MSNVVPLFPPIGDVRVPEPLRELPAWLVWRFEQFAGEAKPRKIPYWADGTRRHGTQGGSTDRDRLTTFVVARDAAVRGGYDGIGFAPLADFGYTFLDFDNCVDSRGDIPAEIEAIVSRTYAEYSPSGKGIRAVLKGDLGNHKSHSTPELYGVETFSSSGFVTLTGNILPACDLLGYEDHVADVDANTRQFAQARFGASATHTVDPDDFMAGREPRLGLSVDEIQTYLSHLDPGMGREPWLRVGMALHHETEGGDDGFELWDEWSSDGDTYPGTEALRYQWDSFKPTPGKRQVTMASVIKMAKEAGYSERKTPTPEEVLERVAEIRAELPNKSTSRFGPVPIFDLVTGEPPRWIIKGVLPDAELGILFGASGSGKAQPLDERVLTAQGWRLMGEIAVGDEVIGSAGLPVRVSGVFPQGEQEEWEIVLSNGERVRCCGDHLWTVRRPGKHWQTLTTKEISERSAPRSRWQIPVVAPVSFAHDPNPLPLDPYLLGALLGDGGITAYVGFSSADQQIVNEIAKVLPAGHRIHKKSTGEYAYMITSAKGQPNHVWTALRLLGLAGRKSEDKHIPQEYLVATPSARLALLQGLMDTDGYVADGNGRTAVFSSSSRELTLGVAELVKSLGGLCRPIRVLETAGLPAYSVSFRSGTGFTPFRLKRKADRCCGGHKLVLTIVSAKPTGRRVPMQCISVQAEDKLYVTSGYTLTHNTFVALDFAFAVAMGLPWRGRRVKKGKVVIIAAEGGSGIGRRGEALALHHGFDLRDAFDIHVITAAPNFLDSEDIAEVIAQIEALGDVDLVIVDTLAQVTPGANENTSEDMGRALANLRLLHTATRAMVLAVHHAGKDLSKGSRGWSGIKAAADVQIEVVRHDDNTREIVIEKMKDGEDGLRWPFKLEVVELGIDEDGDPVTSCVAVETDAPVRQPDEDRKGVKRRGRVENHILEVMSMFGTESTVPAIDLINKAAETLPAPEDGKRDTRRQTVVRALNTLSREKDGPLKLQGNLVIFYE